MQNTTTSPDQLEVFAKRGRGRPAIITLAIVEQIGQLIAKGMTEEQACLRVGVNLNSFRTARQRNPEFELAVKLAQANFLDQAIDIIAKGGRGWQGLAWLLERRHGEQFRRNSGLEVLAQVAPYNAADLLLRKPLHQWAAFDLDQSVGAWKLLKKWTAEQLVELLELYKRHWGSLDQWPDEKLGWAADIEKHLLEMQSSDTGEIRVAEIELEEQVHALIPG